MDSVLREKWFELSLAQQMLNIGNEVKRVKMRMRGQKLQAKSVKQIDVSGGLQYNSNINASRRILRNRTAGLIKR